MDYYVLDGKIPRPATEAEYLAAIKDKRAKFVGREDRGAAHFVSTVFLYLDHNWGGEGGPILFETLVMDRDFNEVAGCRYRTWDEAEAGHKEYVEQTFGAPGTFKVIRGGCSDWTVRELPTLARLYAALECDTIDAITLPGGRVMVVDDNALLTGRPMNERASKMLAAELDRECQPIHGTVAIVNESEFGGMS